MAPPDEALQSEGALEEESLSHDEYPGLVGGPSKKNKNKKRTVIARGPTAMAAFRGTGFEEYYCDPPLTPAEAQEERWGIYAPDLPFEERIQACLQRYRSRRRLQSQHTRYFNEYLLLGGVDSTPNAFAGLSQKDLKDMTPAEQREATAIDSIHMSGSCGRFYDGNEENWAVDFTSIAQGFLSVSIGPLTGLDKEAMEMCISLVENFLRYVLQHDVCPEYEDDVASALEVCEKAKKEWPMIRRLQNTMPGRLNKAATEFLGVSERSDWAQFPDEVSDDNVESDEEGSAISAKALVFSAMALLSDQVTFQKLCDASAAGPLSTRILSGDTRVQSVQRPSEEETKRFLQLQVNDHSISPIGKAVFERTTIRDGWERPDETDPSTAIPRTFDLYLDDRVLKNMVPGMKMNVTVVEVVDVGLYFLKTTGPALPSFYKFLPQELMKRYREPREVEAPASALNNETREDEDPLPDE